MSLITFSLATSGLHDCFKSDENVYGKSKSLSFSSQYKKLLIRVRKHSIILLQIKNYQCYELCLKIIPTLNSVLQ